MSPDALIAALQSLPTEVVLGVEIAVVFAAPLLLLRLFGANGLVMFMALAVIGANIQVLKVVEFGFYTHPVALGTVLFQATFLATDILAEHYGRQKARQAVAMGFVGYGFMLLLMVVTLGYRPVSPDTPGAEPWMVEMHGHLAALFTPQPAILVASLVAYTASQYHDVWLYGLLRRLTHGRHIWLRNNVATILSALIDNTVFSLLAFWLLAPEPVSVQALVYTFILGTFLFRVALALLDTPFLYAARACLPPADRHPGVGAATTTGLAGNPASEAFRRASRGA